jgi:hypothetical protein
MDLVRAKDDVSNNGQQQSCDDGGHFANVDLSASAYSRKKNDELRCLFGNKQRNVSEIVQSFNERGIGHVSLLATQVDPLLPRRSSLERSVARDVLGDRHGSDSVGVDVITTDKLEECEGMFSYSLELLNLPTLT